MDSNNDKAVKSVNPTEYAWSEPFRLFRSWVAQQRVKNLIPQKPNFLFFILISIRQQNTLTFACDFIIHLFFARQNSLKITTDDNSVFKYYDFGPKDVVPLVFIPPTSGTAEVFFKQFLSMCPKGYRLISVSA